MTILVVTTFQIHFNSQDATRPFSSAPQEARRGFVLDVLRPSRSSRIRAYLLLPLFRFIHLNALYLTVVVVYDRSSAVVSPRRSWWTCGRRMRPRVHAIATRSRGARTCRLVSYCERCIPEEMFICQVLLPEVSRNL